MGPLTTDPGGEAALLYEAGALLGRTLDPNRVYDILHTIIARVMACDSLLVSSYTAQDNLIRCSFALVDGTRVDPARFPVLPLAPEGTGMQSQVIRTGRPLCINDSEAQARTGSRMVHVQHDGTVGPDPESEEKRTQSLMIVPIALEGQVLGAVQVSTHRRDAYTPAHLRFLQALLIQVAAASRNAYLYKQAREEVIERRRVEAENARLLQEVQEAAARQQSFLRDVLASVTEGRLRLAGDAGQLPPPLARVGPPLTLSLGGGIRELRRLAVETAAQAGLPVERQHDLETAVGEAAMNAVVHAGAGTGTVSLDARGTVQVRIEDHGEGITIENLPRATLTLGFSTKASLGHGFKMILQTADRVWLLTGPSGTTVVLEQDRVTPQVKW